MAGTAGGRRANHTRPAEHLPRRPRTPRSARRSRDGAGSGVPGAAKPPARPDERITIPMATIFVDADEWDARAHALGGTSNTLLAGLAARLAQRAQRLAADGSVALTIPINERSDGDTRANAVTNVASPSTPHLRPPIYARYEPRSSWR